MENETIEFLKNTPPSKAWQHVEIKPHHGICLPLFSLRSEKSAGIGEYLDLLPVIEWCLSLKMDTLQLLPLNDNGYDASPYSALSAFALNPIYLSLKGLPNWNKSDVLRDLYRSLQDLNQDKRVNYPLVFSLKEKFLREYFKVTEGDIAHSSAYKAFKHQAANWLEKYSLFKSLKMETNWLPWKEWPEKWELDKDNHYKELVQSHMSEITFHSFVQFHCFNQLSFVQREAKRRRFLLKGDIPILLNRESADVWGNQTLFNLSFSAGAPPDMFNSDGQDWGFPLYNWEKIEKDNYSWWIERLKNASHYYSLYRLDHIVGFYRIWATHFENKEIFKGFIPENSESWLSHGEKILKNLIISTEMLPIGEDLGVVPQEVRRNLRSLGICGTKVMRWERKWNEGSEYIPYEEYDLLSMTTVSTHDSETLQLWWKSFPEEALEFAKFKAWEYEPELSKEKHFEILFDSHRTKSLFHINPLQEYLALVPGRTWKAPEEERINIPGTVSEKNWSYKFRPSIEEFTSDPNLRQIMGKIIP